MKRLSLALLLMLGGTAAAAQQPAAPAATVVEIPPLTSPDSGTRGNEMLQIMAGAPTTTASPSMARTPLQNITADNIPPNTMMAADGGDVPAGNPVIVGERGPEMIVPQHNVSVIPHEYLPVLHLLNGQMEQYLKRHLR